MAARNLDSTLSAAPRIAAARARPSLTARTRSSTSPRGDRPDAVLDGKSYVFNTSVKSGVGCWRLGKTATLRCSVVSPPVSVANIDPPSARSAKRPRLA